MLFITWLQFTPTCTIGNGVKGDGRIRKYDRGFWGYVVVYSHVMYCRKLMYQQLRAGSNTSMAISWNTWGLKTYCVTRVHLISMNHYKIQTPLIHNLPEILCQRKQKNMQSLNSSIIKFLFKQIRANNQQDLQIQCKICY